MNAEERAPSATARTSPGIASPQAGELLERCIHCGLCLPACPTYAVFHRETDGPRGRIALMRGVAEDRIDVGGPFTRHIDLCIGCLACVTACPSGVEYDRLLELAQDSVEKARRRGPLGRLARWIAFRQLLPHPRRLRFLAVLARWARATGLLALARSRLAPNAVRRLAELVPAVRREPAVAPTRGLRPRAETRRPRVALFAGCVQEAFLASVNRASERLLEMAGYDVERPGGQTCCGALALHCGDRHTAIELARRNVEAFESDEWDAVMTNAGGCGAMLASYAHLLRGEPDLERRAEALAARVQDVSKLLENAPLPLPAGRLEGRVTYADSCHLRHGQGVADGPRRLLSAVDGIELVEMADPDRCCGSGAAYNLAEGATADRLLDLRVEEIRASGAAIVVSSNPGCQLQIERGLRRAGLDVEVLHLVEVLERAARGEISP